MVNGLYFFFVAAGASGAVGASGTALLPSTLPLIVPLPIDAFDPTACGNFLAAGAVDLAAAALFSAPCGPDA